MGLNLCSWTCTHAESLQPNKVENGWSLHTHPAYTLFCCLAPAEGCVLKSSSAQQAEIPPTPPSPPTDPQPHPAIWRLTEIKSQWRWMILRPTCTAAFIMCHVFPVLQDRTHCWLNAKKLMPIKHLNAFLTGNWMLECHLFFPVWDSVGGCGGWGGFNGSSSFLTNILCL